MRRIKTFAIFESMKHFKEADPTLPQYYNQVELQKKFPNGVTFSHMVGFNMGDDIVYKVSEIRKRIDNVMMECHASAWKPYFRFDGKWWKGIDGASVNQIVEDFGNGANVDYMIPVTDKALAKLGATIKKYGLKVVALNK